MEIEEDVVVEMVVLSSRIVRERVILGKPVAPHTTFLGWRQMFVS